MKYIIQLDDLLRVLPYRQERYNRILLGDSLIKPCSAGSGRDFAIRRANFRGLSQVVARPATEVNFYPLSLRYTA